MYQELTRLSKGLSDRQRYLITSARSLTMQMLSLLYYHNNIQAVALTQEIIEKTVAEILLQNRAIQAADSIHVITAIMYNSQIIISSDNHILELNELFENADGTKIQCLDTNKALAVLKVS